MLKLYLDIIMGRQLDRLMPFWQPVNILYSVLIFMLLWEINIVVVGIAVINFWTGQGGEPRLLLLLSKNRLNTHVKRV